MTHMTQNKSLWRCCSQPISWLLLRKLNLTQQKQPFTIKKHRYYDTKEMQKDHSKAMWSTLVAGNGLICWMCQLCNAVSNQSAIDTLHPHHSPHSPYTLHCATGRLILTPQPPHKNWPFPWGSGPNPTRHPKRQLDHLSRPTNIHCVSKNDTDVAYYNFNEHQPTFVIFGSDVAEEVC